MIVIPLTEESRSGRRPPWLTLGLVAVCLVVFLDNRASDQEVDARTDAAIEEAWTYYSAHPYVKVDADLSEMMGEDAVTAAAQAFRSDLRASGSPGIPRFVRVHDQVDFDAIVDRIYDAMEEHSFYRLGFFPETLSHPDSSLLTYVFVHEDWLHLLPNLALILIAGLFLEEVWGRGIYFAFLLTAAVAGAVGYAVFDPEAGDALGGASGVAAALAGAFFIRFASVRLRFQYFLIPPFGGKFTARGWVTLPIYGGLYGLAEYLVTQGAPGIEPVSTEFATWAHAGGMAWGVLFALMMKLLRIEQRVVKPKQEKKRTTRSNPLLERALEARESGRLEEAMELLAGEVSRHPGNRDAALAYWDAATAVGRPEQAADVLVRVLRDEVISRQSELALQHWRELTQRAPGFLLEATVELRVIALLIEAAEYDLADFSMRRILGGQCGAVSGATAHRLARTAKGLDTELALKAARMALAAPDLEPSERAEVERLAQQLQAVDPREQEAVAAEVEGGRSVDFDGDTLNAEPFELDEPLEAPGINTYDLEAAEDPAGHATAGDGGEAQAAGAPATAPSGAPSPGRSAPGPPRADPVPGAGATRPPHGDPSPALGDTRPSLGESSPFGATHSSLSDSSPSLGPIPSGPGDSSPSFGQGPSSWADSSPSLDLASPPLLAPDDDQIPLADESVRTHPSISPDDTGAPDFGQTLDLESLGARTVPGFEAGPDPPEAPASAAPGPPAAGGSPPPESSAALETPELVASARRSLRKMEAIPIALGEDSLTLDVGERGKAQLAFGRIDAISVAGVRGLRPKPVVVIDLVTNWLADETQILKIVRLRSDRFDPRQLVPGEENGFQALKRWITEILAKTQATPLPDPRSAVGAPFRMFEALENYEREVLRVL